MIPIAGPDRLCYHPRPQQPVQSTQGTPTMARRRSRPGNSFGVMSLGLLALVAIGWLGWRGGWWPVDVAPAATNPAISETPLEQSRRAAELETQVVLPNQFEPPITTPLPAPRVVAGSESSFPTATDASWRPTGSRPTGQQLASVASSPAQPAGTPRIEPVATGLDPAGPRTLTEIDALIADGDLVAAHKALSWIYFQQPGERPKISERIERTAGAVFFSPRPHILPAHTLQPGDSLAAIAPRYKIGWQYLAALNHVSPRKIRSGQTLKVVRGPFRVVVDLSEFSLVVRTRSEYVRRFQIGIGRDHSTPLGRFRVLRKVPDPQYTDPDGRVIPAAVPENPLGRFWIDLGEGYGIHGTNQPESVGRAESRGCLRLRNNDIQLLYGMLVTGCEVVIHR